MFPIKQKTFVAFLLWAKVTCRLAFNTIQNACHTRLNLWCINQSVNYDDPKTKYDAILNSIIVTLLCAYSNTEKVTDALLYTYFVNLLRKINLIKEENCCIFAIVAFIYMEIYHFNSITHMTIDDLSFKLYNHKI
jgi:hypothetical protein